MSDLRGTLDGSGGEWEEDGFHLTLTTDEGEKATLRVPMEEGRELLAALDPMRDWISTHDRELAAFRARRPDPAGDDGYDLSDPKHPTYYERMVDR